mgnify:CR=1 FL=1
MAEQNTPILLDNLAADSGLDAWDIGEAIGNTKNYAVGGLPSPVQLADGILMPHTPSGRIGKVILQRAWLDNPALTLQHLGNFREACRSVERMQLAKVFEQVLSMFGGA